MMIDDLARERLDLADAIKHARRIPREVSVLDACREVVEKGYSRHRGVMIDAYTASAIVQIHDALNEQNQAKYAKYDEVKYMAHIAFELMEKTR